MFDQLRQALALNKSGKLGQVGEIRPNVVQDDSSLVPVDGEAHTQCDGRAQKPSAALLRV
jgi:hypothetical protein